MGLVLSGDSGLSQFLEAKTKIGTEVIAAVKRNGASMQEQAQRNAPVDTGFLKRQIFLNLINAGTDFSAEVSGDASYDPYQEYGTRFMPGKPHIRPAYYSQRDQFIKDINSLVGRK